MAEPTDYDNADFIPDGAGYYARWEAAAAAFRARVRSARLGVRYGDHPREAFDLFLPEGAPRGLVVFFHGGFWRMGAGAMWSHLAAGPLAAGHACAMPSYPLCPEVGIADITRSATLAAAAAAAEAPGPIGIAGHSAGGHLALRMVCADRDMPREVAMRVAGVLAISPLTDLAPLMAMPMNADLRIDASVAQAESLVHHPAPAVPVEVLVGARERPAFLDQALCLADAWPAAEITIAPDKHHFDVVEALEDAAHPALARLLGRLEAR